MKRLEVAFKSREGAGERNVVIAPTSERRPAPDLPVETQDTRKESLLLLEMTDQPMEGGAIVQGEGLADPLDLRDGK